MLLSDNLLSIKGIGEKKAALFEKMEISHVRNLLFHFPRTYHTYPEPVSTLTESEQAQTLALTLRGRPFSKRTRRMVLTVAHAVAFGEEIELVWFGAPYITKKIPAKGIFYAYGKLKKTGPFLWKMEHPELFTEDEYKELVGKFLPVYPLTKGLNNQTIRKALMHVFDSLDEDPEYLPEDILKTHSLLNRQQAIRDIHFPKEMDALSIARNRLCYDEFFLFFMQMYDKEKCAEAVSNTFVIKQTTLYERVYASLPFELTAGQKTCLLDIVSDFNGPTVNQRLIQGDVGSGKTVIAFLAMLLMVENGYQTALMAPTEVLAMQHYHTFLEMVETYALPYEVILLTGAMSAKEKREAKERILHSGASFIIGTHALIQEGVTYHQLGLVITDEQHRFGVKQRQILADKGAHPFALVMSATPIPRTLALILYGDMQVSVIKDVPKTKLPIKNCVIRENDRHTAYQFLMREINSGHQAYIICPLVEASEKTESENVTEYVKKLESILPESVHIGLLHGRMSAADKTSVMEDFYNNTIQILVSTTVVEVGVNVPNATAIMIENANRFGLAQLHQLRGRVGRGNAQSYCILMDASDKEEPSKRLEILNQSNDGFFIAGEDLKLRGPGDFYGIRQSGAFDFKLADIYQDADLLKCASEDAKRLLQEDPGLNNPAHKALQNTLKQTIEDTYHTL